MYTLQDSKLKERLSQAEVFALPLNCGVNENNLPSPTELVIQAYLPFRNDLAIHRFPQRKPTHVACIFLVKNTAGRFNRVHVNDPEVWTLVKAQMLELADKNSPEFTRQIVTVYHDFSDID